MKPENGTESISAFFENDHREIDAILASVPFGSPDTEPRLVEFDRRLERHMHWEEGILFPAVSAKAPELEMGPLRVMALEHEEIRKHKAAARRALRKGEAETAKRQMDAMALVLREHNVKEEQVLYPACDRLFSSAETKDILGQVRGRASLLKIIAS